MLDRVPPHRLAAAFRWWGDHAGGSPLYRHLASGVAREPRLLEVAAGIEHTPVPNLLFAAVHLLLRPSEPLARYYPSLVDEAVPPDDDAVPELTAFVLRHVERIQHIGRTRHAQTNEPRRSSVLLPWLAQAARRLGEPVHLLEVGASAGLNLCLDGYTHRYSSGVALGDGSPLLRVDDSGPVPHPGRFPEVVERVGIDLDPLDLSDPEDVAWALALIWPEQTDRRERFLQAARVRRSRRLRMVRGDVAEVLPEVLASLPEGPVVVWHSLTWNQLGREQRSAFDRALADAGRPLARVGLELWEEGAAWPEIRVGIDSRRMATVARAHHHGEWVEASPDG